MHAFSIRLGADGDVEPLLALLDAVAQEGTFIGTEPGYDRDLYRRRFKQSIASPQTTPVFVACVGTELVGQLSIFEHAELGPTIGMMVKSGYRGWGIGRALLARAVGWGADHGVGALHLFVFPHNARARSLYRRAGFVEVERYERDVTRRSGEEWDSLLMRKELS